jgi:hypothetical protein
MLYDLAYQHVLNARNNSAEWLIVDPEAPASWVTDLYHEKFQ